MRRFSGIGKTRVRQRSGGMPWSSITPSPSRQVRKIFEGHSRGDWQSALAGMAERFEHIFPGDHALGGTRHSKAGLRAWFQRLFAVYPQLRFEIKHIASSGTPWDTTAVIEWRDYAVMADGDTSYVNDGMHLIRLR